MPEPAEPPELDQTADAKPYEPPKPRRKSVVATILGLLGVALVLAIAGVVISSNRVTTNKECDRCESNLRVLGLALHIYAEESAGAFPPDLGCLWPQYVESPQIFSCPSNPGKWGEIAKTGKVTRASTSYVYVAGLRLKDESARIADDRGCVLVYERKPHRRRPDNVLFVDGSIPSVMRAELPRLVEQTRLYLQKDGREMKLIGE